MEACTLPLTVKLPNYINKREFAGCNLNPVVVLTDCRKSLKKTTPDTPPPSPVGNVESQSSCVSKDDFSGGCVEIKNDDTVSLGPGTRSPSRRKRKRRARESSDSADSPPEYEIERIVGYHRDKRKKMWYFVKWKGWEDEFNTFEPIDNLTRCHYKLMEYFAIDDMTREDMKEKDEELLRGATKSDMYRKLTSNACTADDLEDFLQEFPCEFAGLFGKGLERLERDVATEYRYIVRCLIGMCRHQDPGLILRGQNYKLFLILIQQRRQQLQNLAETERMINAREVTKINVVNDVDLENFPRINYIVEMKPGEGVVLPKEPLLGCECYSCKPKSPCCGKLGDSVFAYNPDGRLRISKRVAIYECNSRCPCPPTCPNRVVQRGRQVKLCIFRTKHCGWGVRAGENIPKGTFVCEYLGELIPDSEANVRDVHSYWKGKCRYMFNLDFFTDSNLEMFCIDATKYGNVARFINHSCDPNLIVYPVWVDGLAPNIHRLAFFARRRIREGEEIHFDYENLENANNVSEDNEQGYTVRMMSDVRCQCNSVNCRKWVFGNK